MWVEQLPATIAPEGFQTHQRLVASPAPVLSGPFEADLILSACRLYRSASHWLACRLALRVVHASLVLFEVVLFPSHLLALCSLQPPSQFFEFVYHAKRLAGVEFV